MKTFIGVVCAALIQAVATVGAATAQTISLDDIVAGRYRARGVRGIVPLADGESFSCVSDDGRRIVRCAYRTGEETATLFSLDEARMVGKDGAARAGRVSEFSDYIVSPDEKNILIETNRTPIYRRSATADYYLYNIRNKTLMPLSDGGAQEVPKFSPDGTMVAFVRGGNIFLVKLLYGNAETQVTDDGRFNHIINGKPDWVYEEEFEFNRAFDFSADSRLLAWVRFDESRVPVFGLQYFRGAYPAMDTNKLYPSLYEYKYPKAGEANSSVAVKSYDIKSRVTRTMNVPLESDGYVPRIQFTGEADKLAVVTLNRHQNRCDIYMVNARSGVAQLALRETDDRYVDLSFYADIDFSRPQFVVLSERDGHRHLYLYTLGGKLVRQLTSGSYVVTDFYGTDADGRQFYYACNEGSPLEQYVCRVDANGKSEKLTKQKGFNAAVFSTHCRYFVNTYSNITTPPVHSLYSAGGKQLRVMEDNAALRGAYAKLDIAKPEIFSFTTADGVQLNGWMVKPANFDASKKYPVLMYQYSGPGNQQVYNSWNVGNSYGLIWEHRLAQKGYVVVCVDGRGTGGRGADFQKCTYLTMGDKESHDQVEAAVYLGSLPYVDKERIAIWGWSFGGFNTIMSMAEGRPVFRCGVAVAPVTDWRYYDTAYTERYMRTPQENPDGYDMSPLHRFQKLHGDLLICHGLTDDNVHFQNTAELVEQLTQANIQFEMQTYTNRNHGIYGGNTRRHLFTRIENFLDRHLKP